MQSTLANRRHVCRYGKMVEDTFGQYELLTHQLHQCTLHAFQQLKECGPGAFSLDAWIERMVGGFKKITKYRCTRYPEMTAVNHMLFGQRLAECESTSAEVRELYDEAMRKNLSTTTKATKKRQQLAHLKDHEPQDLSADSPGAGGFLVGTTEDITRQGALVSSTADC